MRTISLDKNICRTNWKILVAIFVYVVFLLFWISRNSYTYDLFSNVDNSWYFTCGKAWMNGLVPYVDFSDSKGPLLWLIYGVGYLISPVDYIGVFWIECLFYTATFWLVFKTAVLFCSSKSTALAATFLTSLFFFNSLHFETKTEDFCMPFIAAGLYCIMRLYYSRDNNIFGSAFTLGVGAAVCLLIKYSISIVYLAFFIALFWYVVKYDVRKLMPAVFLSIAGFLIIILPFVGYFLAVGNFQSFINEYFVNTYLTVHTSVGETLRSYFADDLWKIVSFKKSTYSLFVVAVIIGIILFCMQHPVKSRFVPLFMVTWFVAIAARHNITNHYMLVAAPFGLLAILALSRFVTISFVPAKVKPVLTAVLTIAIVILVWQKIWKRPNFFLNDNDDRRAFYNTVALMNEVENPTYMSAVVLPMFDVPVNALPACRYWILQTGATGEMIQRRNDAIRQKKADFIIWADLPPITHPDSQELLLESGYRVAYSDTIRDVFGYPVAYHLYVRSGIQLHHKIQPSVSNTDVLLKRTLENQ